jgi:hypothetical protein
MARITYNDCPLCKEEHKSLRMTIRLKNIQGRYIDVSIGDYILPHDTCGPTAILDKETIVKLKCEAHKIKIKK